MWYRDRLTVCWLTFLGVLLWGQATMLAADEREWPPFVSSEVGHLFTLHGSNTVGASLAPALVRDYLLAKGAVEVTIRAGAQANEYRVEGRLDAGLVSVNIAAHGSGTGMRGLKSGEADIAMASRPIKASEIQLLSDFGDMRTPESEHIVAIDGLAVIVNRGNPIETLTVDEIARLFAGEVRNWSELGGLDMPVTLYARDNKSGTWDSFNSMVLGRGYNLATTAARFESNDDLSDSVSTDLGAIGFVGLASVRDARALSVSLESTQPLKPEPLYVATEDYPLSRRLFMYTLPGRTPLIVQEFIQYAQSAAGQNRVAEVGFVSQNPVSLKPGLDPGAPPAYNNLVEHAERLSINFRFDEGSSRLDNKAIWDVERLRRFIEAPENHGRHIQLIGFGDAKQSERRALVLSKMRALRVKSALRDLDIHVSSVTGFGSYLPVAANLDTGRFKNQRVEVWVFDAEQQPTVSRIKRERGEQPDPDTGSLLSRH